MVIAITGATGFIGCYIMRALFNMKGIEIKALARENADLNVLNEFSEKTTIVKGDLADKNSLAELVEGADAVIHGAYYSKNRAFLGAGNEDREVFLRTNVLGSHNLLELSKKAGVKRFIFISSCAVFGAIDPALPLNEKHPLMPDSVYGAYKASVESLCHAYYLSEGMETVIFRPVGVYGKKNQIEQSRWYNLIQDIKAGKDVNVSGGGKVVHALDVVQAILLALEKQDAVGNVYALVDFFIDNMGVARMCRDIFGSTSEISGEPKTPKNFMLNEKVKELGVNLKGKAGLKEYIMSF